MEISRKNLRKAPKKRTAPSVLVIEPETWQEGYSETAISESLYDSTVFDWSSEKEFNRIESLSLSGRLLNPFVSVVDDLPSIPARQARAVFEIVRDEPTGLQRSQIRELFELFLKSGMSREEALEKLGPLAFEITKYKHSFVVSEFRWPVKGFEAQFYDRPFMAPVKK